MSCKACEQSSEKCICPAVDKFFSDNRDLMDALRGKDQATPEEREAFAKSQPGAKRCLACFFFLCRCAAGHLERLKHDPNNL